MLCAPECVTNPLHQSGAQGRLMFGQAPLQVIKPGEIAVRSVN